MLAEERILSINLPNFLTIGAMYLGWLAVLVLLLLGFRYVSGRGG